MVQTKGQIIENSNLLFRLHHQRFYPKEFIAPSSKGNKRMYPSKSGCHSRLSRNIRFP